VTAHEVEQELAVLHEQWAVQTPGVPQLVDHRRTRLLAQVGADRVTGRELEQEEGSRRHTQDDRDGGEQPPQDVADHA
jgi:hypothetical protein